MALALQAQAKVNLHLEVLGRRPDGYHELNTVLHALELADTLTAELGPPGDGVELAIEQGVGTGMAVPATPDNLVWQATDRFFAAVPELPRRVVRFHLEKAIPAGGGLGGGSSDAAAALRLLDALFDEPLGLAGLHAVAAGMSADAPFFLRGGTCRGIGTGTELTVVPDPPELHFLLILPPVGASTPAVYGNLNARPLTGSAAGASIRGAKEPPECKELALSSGFRNDLEASALQLYPALKELRQWVVDAGYPGVRMSGSGSTFYLPLKDAAESADAMDTLAPLGAQGIGLVQTRSSRRHPGVTRSAWPDQSN